MAKLSNYVQICQAETVVNFLDCDIEHVACQVEQVKTGTLYGVIDEYLEYGQWRKGHLSELPYAKISAIITEKRIKEITLPQIIVQDSRKALAKCCQYHYKNIDEKIKIIGITGTNGKTTVSHLINQWMNLLGTPCVAMGTLGIYRETKQIAELGYTTPLACHLYESLVFIERQNIKNIAMEISSHALALDRVYGLTIDMAIFTNFTRDHLDFHKTSAHYYHSKLKLFEAMQPRQIVLNGDDVTSHKIKAKLKREVITYGLLEGVDYQAKNIKMSTEGSQFDCHYQQVIYPVTIPLIGEYNIYNALAAMVACHLQGISLQALAWQANQLPGIPGRMERVICPRNIIAFVDYCHTPDSLQQALITLRRITDHQIITVFGCGGDRDKGKRTMMGEVAEKYSNYSIITTDNPRTEAPYAIILEIEKGMTQQTYSIEIDRKLAICKAYQMAQAGDVLLIAGKGHETYQIIGSKKIAYSDIEVLQTLEG